MEGTRMKIAGLDLIPARTRSAAGIYAALIAKVRELPDGEAYVFPQAGLSKYFAWYCKQAGKKAGLAIAVQKTRDGRVAVFKAGVLPPSAAAAKKKPK